MSAQDSPEIDEMFTQAAGQGILPASLPLAVVTRRSEKIGSLVAALAAAQLEFQPVLKDQKNPYYNSKYADLSSVISATQPALAKNGLVVLQVATVDVENQRVTVTSTLAHASDQWIENELTLPAVMVGKDGRVRFDSQSCGAAFSYGRRYSYQGLVGVTGEDDNDANSAIGIGSKEAAQAIGARKVEELKANACLFYSWSDEKQEGYITGDKDLLTANKELLLYKGKLSADKKYIVVDAQGLEDLKFEFEQRKVNLRPLKGK